MDNIPVDDFLDRTFDLDDDVLDEYESVVLLESLHHRQHIPRQLCRTSQLTGHAWVMELMNGHPARCYENFRMEQHVFTRLCTELQQCGLKSTQRMGVPEIVGMFLFMVGQGASNRALQERFQRSGDTVSRHLHRVLEAMRGLTTRYIRPKDRTFSQVDPIIREDTRYFPYFKDAIGAIDGTHVHCIVEPSEQPKYIGRKGHTTQNIMAICDWDLCFTFVLAGWEGSAHDARVFQHALTSSTFPHPPPGKYYLVDSGYPTRPGYMGPYRRETYHVPDFRRRASTRFTNTKELFNYYHSSLRTTIERAFGCWKKKFAILRDMFSFSIDTQVQIVIATMTLHNFIRKNSRTDEDFMQFENEEEEEDADDDDDDTQTQSNLGATSTEMDHLRDCIRDQILEHTRHR